MPLSRYAGEDFAVFLEACAEELGVDDYYLVQFFLLLDGLNEVSPEFTSQVQDWVVSHNEISMVVTCRTLDYVESKLPLQRIDVAPLGITHIHQFIGNYLEDEYRDPLFWALAGEETYISWEWFCREKPDASFEDFWLSDELPGHSFENEYIHLCAVREAWIEGKRLPGMLGIVTNPFLLFVTIQVYICQGSPPTNRGQLFEQFVTLLMTERGKPAANIRPPWINKIVQCQALAALAYQMQSEHKSTSVDESWAKHVISEALPEENVDHLIYLTVSSSIIEKGKKLRFSHQLLQEYFAAYEMKKDLQSGVPATKYWKSDHWWEPTVWDETALFLAGILGDATEIVHWLAPVQPTLAYRCAIESGASCAEEVLQSLYECPDEKPVCPLARAEWGRILAEEGDTRAGVGLNSDGLPDIAWCKVPASTFWMGGDLEVGPYGGAWEGAEIDIPYTFWIAKYPVTYIQYEAFVNDGGYNDLNYWTEAGKKWRIENDIKEPLDWRNTQFHINNYPVVSVSWMDVNSLGGINTSRVTQISTKLVVR